MTPVELDAPAQPRSILVIEGGRSLTAQQADAMRTEIRAALDGDKWPLILFSEGSVYWVPIDDKLQQFVEWLISLDDPTDDAAVEARRRITLTEIIRMAKEAAGVDPD